MVPQRSRKVEITCLAWSGLLGSLARSQAACPSLPIRRSACSAGSPPQGSTEWLLHWLCCLSGSGTSWDPP